VVLLEQIIDEIRSEGPIGFDRFMEIALYDPAAGYYSTGILRSDQSGDFLTSPEVSPLFGETIARFVTAEHDRIGEPFTMVEVGGGSGSLLRPLLDALDIAPRVMAVERSAAARASIGETVSEAEIVDELGTVRGVIIANELLDNMPAALVVRRGSGWQERRVGLADGGLELVEVPPPPEVAEWADRYAGPVPEGGQVEVQLIATEWVRDAGGCLEGGALLLFDYGEVAENLEHRRPEGTVRTYRAHHLGPDPLAEPGATDITMDVNFSAVVAVAEDSGYEVELLRQDDFLEQWGLRDLHRDLRDQELVAAREGRSMDRLRLRSRVTEAETLLHPRGLGDFRVVVVRC
jgi:SAM-dependent MidA family methyltransferase